ncbi:4Fe-4S binding protein [bacterium]|nr:4Fe-4S binding protein [bacterium]
MSYIEIDKTKCKSCYLCMDACPNHLIQKSDCIGKFGQCTVEFNDLEGICTACARCAMVCPDLAIVKVVKN